MLWNILSGIALAAIAVAMAMMVAVVFRLVREAQFTGTLRRKLPMHIMLVSTGTMVWGAAQFDTVSDHLGDGLPPEWSAAPAGLLGALILHVALWKMIEVQRLRYRTLGGHATAGDVAGEYVEEAAPLADRNAERISRVTVENRVLFSLAMIGLIFGFLQVATVTHNTCKSNNAQDRVLERLVRVSLSSADPADPRSRTPAARQAEREFTRALAELHEPQKCPRPGL